MLNMKEDVEKARGENQQLQRNQSPESAAQHVYELTAGAAVCGNNKADEGHEEERISHNSRH